MQKVGRKTKDELQPEYDFANMPGGVKGKYVERYRQGTNLALLDRDVAAAFPDDEAVNEALRSVMNAAERLSKSIPHKHRKRAVPR